MQGLASCRMLLQVAQHMLKLRVLRPAAVIGTGCYAAFPACLAAALCGMPLFLIEPNAVPGPLTTTPSMQSLAVKLKIKSLLTCEMQDLRISCLLLLALQFLYRFHLLAQCCPKTSMFLSHTAVFSYTMHFCHLTYKVLQDLHVWNTCAQNF